MKIYLAAPYAARDFLKKEVEFWASQGHIVTCGWVKGTRPLGVASYGVSPMSTNEEVEAHARGDLEDISRADVLVHYTPEYLLACAPEIGSGGLQHLYTGGRHVETGYALAKEIPVVILGPRENVFQRGLCMWADDRDAALFLVDTLRV